MKTLVIGYGNPLRGDDAFGWTVAGEVAALHAGDDQVRILTAHQLMPEHAEWVGRAQRVIFVDASREGDPGTWTVTEVTASRRATTFAHALDPATLLACARDLYRAHPFALVVSAPGASFACDESLTPVVAALVPAVVASIHALIQATHPSTPRHA